MHMTKSHALGRGGTWHTELVWKEVAMGKAAAAGRRLRGPRLAQIDIAAGDDERSWAPAPDSRLTNHLFRRRARHHSHRLGCCCSSLAAPSFLWWACGRSRPHSQRACHRASVDRRNGGGGSGSAGQISPTLAASCIKIMVREIAKINQGGERHTCASKHTCS